MPLPWNTDRIDIPRDKLFDMYWRQGQTTVSIARDVGCSDTTILKRMREYGIPRRPRNCREKTLCRELSDFEKGYISALVDGEGTIWFQKTRCRSHPVVEISNTSIALLKKAQGIIGGNIVKGSTGSKTSKPYYKLRITRSLDVIELLSQIESHLIVKRRKAKRLLDFFSEEYTIQKLIRREKESG